MVPCEEGDEGAVHEGVPLDEELLELGPHRLQTLEGVHAGNGSSSHAGVPPRRSEAMVVS